MCMIVFPRTLSMLALVKYFPPTYNETESMKDGKEEEPKQIDKSYTEIYDGS